MPPSGTQEMKIRKEEINWREVRKNIPGLSIHSDNGKISSLKARKYLVQSQTS